MYPRYVQLTELTMLEVYGLELFKLKRRYWIRLVLAALDAETQCEPEEVEGYVGIVVSDEWRAIRDEVRMRR